jgi:peptidyl-prolyl cis-trans isomerase C
MSFKSQVSMLAVTAFLAMPTFASAESHASADTVVATVNGTDITLGHMIILKQRLPEQYQQIAPDVLFDGILDQLVQQTLLGNSIDTLSKEAQLTLENEDRAVRAAEALRLLVSDVVTEDAVQEAYERLYGDVEPSNEYNASHILVTTEEEAQALVTDLEGGADFAELAKEKSTGPSGPRGGELGWFGSGAMVAPFEEAVVALEVGAVSAPVQTQFGWHVIKLNETRLKGAPDLEEVRAEVTEDVRMGAVDAQVSQLTDQADITRMTAEDIDPALMDDRSLLEN